MSREHVAGGGDAALCTTPYGEPLQREGRPARDGLLPGRYRASIRCLKSFGDETTAVSSHVPEGFVGPEFTVPEKPAAPVTVTIDVR